MLSTLMKRVSWNHYKNYEKTLIDWLFQPPGTPTGRRLSDTEGVYLTTPFHHGWHHSSPALCLSDQEDTGSNRYGSHFSDQEDTRIQQVRFTLLRPGGYRIQQVRFTLLRLGGYRIQQVRFTLLRLQGSLNLDLRWSVSFDSPCPIDQHNTNVVSSRF